MPNLFDKYKTNNEYYSFLTTQKNVITEILIEFKQDNLRIISFYLDALERIFPALNNIEANYIQEIVFFSAVIAIEYKNGGLTSSDYMNFKGIDTIDEHYFPLYDTGTIRDLEKEEEERDKPYAETFYEKYLDKKAKAYFFYPSIYSYILSGYFNQEQLENEIKKRYPEVISKEIQDFRTLLHYNFRELSDEDFKRLTKDVLVYAKEGKYSIYDYVQIAKFFYFFSNNELITESKEDIDRILNDGLDIAKIKKQINDSVLESLLYFKEENPDVTVIKELAIDIHNEFKKEEYVENSNELIDCLKNKDEFELTKFFDKHKFSKELFQYTNDKLLLETIVKISNKQLSRFTRFLQNRYEISNIGELLFEDIGCLNKLKIGLSNYLKKNENIEKLRRFLLEALKKALMQIVQHLDDTRKK